MSNNLSSIELANLLTEAINHTEVGITIADCSESDMPLVFVNTAFEKMTGYTETEVKGINCRFLQGDSQQEKEREIIRQSIKQEKSCQVLLRNYRKNGEPFSNELHLSPIFNKNGELDYYVGIQHDVTEREELREQLEIRKTLLIGINKKLKRLSDDKSRLLTTVAHDLRSPLAGIQGVLEILKNEEDKEQKSLFIDQALISIEKLNSLVTDYLNYGAIEKGAFELQKEDVDLKKFSATLFKRYEFQAKSKEISIEHEENFLKEKAYFDADRVEQCVNNIFQNALKYSHRKGTISLHFSSDEKSFNMEVEDKGIGIKKDDFDNLFSVFSKASGKTTEGESSFGVGLSIVKKIIEMHEGTVDVKSEWQKGTRFCLSIPLKPNA